MEEGAQGAQAAVRPLELAIDIRIRTEALVFIATLVLPEEVVDVK